ncbi:MAG: hypothetical protein LBI82_01065 [Dysgonamonadaceae bacterium]|jgi:hypothetical protein|nr:hypothetical protein [Dysgonamonadaceae bacterium]
MKSNIFSFAVLILLFCNPVSGQNFKLDDPDNLFSKKEKTILENAINYEMDFFNRTFTNKIIDFSEINFTIIPNYMSYLLYQSKSGGVARQSSGYYSHSKQELVICNDKKYKNSFLKTCFHELSHAFLHLHTDKKQIPAWFNEGLAEYLGKMTFSSKKITHKTDTYLLARVKTLIELREINLAEFVNWDYRKFATESFTQEGYGYAISYCMVLFLMQQQDETQTFTIFRDLIGTKSTINVFDNYYKGGFVQFEKDFIAYFSK